MARLFRNVTVALAYRMVDSKKIAQVTFGGDYLRVGSAKYGCNSKNCRVMEC